MATIDDIRAVERLMQTLDENPHLMEAVRSRVLTRELLELPQTMARLTERVDQVEGQLSRLTERVDKLTERVDRIEEQLARLTERVDQLTEAVADMNRRLERVELGVNRLRDDFGTFRAEAAANAALRNSDVIALDVGLIKTGKVSQGALIAMTRSGDTTGISGDDLRSFHLADLVLEAVDDHGDQHYIAVEASYTADRRDTRRAVRNARYLTRFTGQPAHAVVVAMRTDWEIEEQIASRQVHLFQLEDRNRADL